MQKKLIILSGPSGIGKTALLKAFNRHYPDVKYRKAVLITSRPPREDKGEIHGISFYFLPRGVIASLKSENLLVGPVRTDLQAVDMEQIEEIFWGHTLIIADMYPTLGSKVADWKTSHPTLLFDIKTIALVPGTINRIGALALASDKTPEEYAYDLVKRYQILRGDKDTAKIEDRAKSAYSELEMMSNYSDIIINNTPEGAMVDKEIDGKTIQARAWEDPMAEEPLRVLKEFADIVLA